MKINNIIIFSLLSIMFLSCEDKPLYDSYSFEHKITLNRNHVKKIPGDLEKKIESDFFNLSDRPIERTETQKKVALKNTARQFMPIKAYLIDKESALIKDSFLFESQGGGEIELSEYMSGEVGDFIFGIILDPKYNEENTKVYFLSNIKSRGCNKYKDISSHFFEKIRNKGLLTTSKDLIYLKLLVGTFVFISNIDEEFYLGQLHISDKRIQEVLCR